MQGGFYQKPDSGQSLLDKDLRLIEQKNASLQKNIEEHNKKILILKEEISKLEMKKTVVAQRSQKAMDDREQRLKKFKDLLDAAKSDLTKERKVFESEKKQILDTAKNNDEEFQSKAKALALKEESLK